MNVELDNLILLTVKPIKVGNPPIWIYQVELWRDPGSLTETFGSMEQVNAFKKGLEAAASYSDGRVHIEEILTETCIGGCRGIPETDRWIHCPECGQYLGYRDDMTREFVEPKVRKCNRK